MATILDEQESIVETALDGARKILHKDPIFASSVAATVVMALHFLKANGASSEFIRTMYDEAIRVSRHCIEAQNKLN